MKYILERLSHQSIGCGSYAYKDTHSRDGQIFLPIDTPDPYALYSKDNGKSWKTLSLETGRKTDRFIQLQDGSFYALSFDNVVHDAIRNYHQQHIPFVAGIYRANTMEDIIAGNINSSFTQIDIPDFAWLGRFRQLSHQLHLQRPHPAFQRRHPRHYVRSNEGGHHPLSLFSNPWRV